MRTWPYGELGMDSNLGLCIQIETDFSFCWTAALKAGADGYINKDSSQVELIQSIQDILDGKQGLHTIIIEEIPH